MSIALPNQLKNTDSLAATLAQLRRVVAIVTGRVQELKLTVADDEFRGLYVTEEEVGQLLADPDLFALTAAPLSQVEFDEAGGSRVAHLQQAFGLSPFELDVILLALAPEVELRFEKLFAFLQDDVTRRRPSVDLALKLLCPGLAGQVAARPCFEAASPLLKYRLIELHDEHNNRPAALLSRYIKLDEGVTAFLLGQPRPPDPRLSDLVQCETQPKNGLTNGLEYLPRLIELGQSPEGFICNLTGADSAVKDGMVIAVGTALNKPVFQLDAKQWAALPNPAAQLKLLARESRLHSAILYWQSGEALAEETEFSRTVALWLNEAGGITFISTVEPAIPLAPAVRPEIRLNIAPTGYVHRQTLWENLLGASAVGLDLEGLASRFRLGPGQIQAAATTARNAAWWRGESVPTLADLENACRAHSSHALSSLARKVTPLYSWNDIVLPPDQYRMLREICEQVKHRAQVFEKWGFNAKLSLGRGLNVIFAGPSGTGKTMSAEIIANELRMDMYKIDLSNMISKYIGETEKNLERIFTQAGESNAILFFDEADSLFGKRSEVKDAHDRYANIETGYLLQRMEEYEGVVILATNLRKNLDEAFARRMHFIIEYPFPEEADRLAIWRKALPASLPLAHDVDLNFMARAFKIAGGNIKNIVLAAAFLAAGEGPGTSVSMRHFIWATKREFYKIGKLCTQTDFGPYFGWLAERDKKF